MSKVAIRTAVSDVRARLGFREPGLAKFQARALSLRPPGLGLSSGLSCGFGVQKCSTKNLASAVHMSIAMAMQTCEFNGGQNGELVR